MFILLKILNLSNMENDIIFSLKQSQDYKQATIHLNGTADEFIALFLNVFAHDPSLIHVVRTAVMRLDEMMKCDCVDCRAYKEKIDLAIKKINDEKK